MTKEEELLKVKTLEVLCKSLKTYNEVLDVIARTTKILVRYKDDPDVQEAAKILKETLRL